MTWDEETHDDGSGDPWAARTAVTLKLTERISTLLFVGAGLALVLGLVMAVGTYNAADGQLADAGALFSWTRATRSPSCSRCRTWRPACCPPACWRLLQ